MRREAKAAKRDLTKRVLVMSKEEEKPLKQLSQRVPKRMFVWAATDITSSSEAYVNKDSLLKGE